MQSHRPDSRSAFYTSTGVSTTARPLQPVPTPTATPARHINYDYKDRVLQQADGSVPGVRPSHAAVAPAFHWSPWNNCSAVCVGQQQQQPGAQRTSTSGRARGFQQRFALCDDERVDLSECLPAELEPVQVKLCTVDCNSTL